VVAKVINVSTLDDAWTVTTVLYGWKQVEQDFAIFRADDKDSMTDTDVTEHSFLSVILNRKSHRRTSHIARNIL
jgi:hypothetical protein